MRIYLFALLLSISNVALSVEWTTTELLDSAIIIDLPSNLKFKENSKKKVVLVNKSGLAKFSFGLTETAVDTKTIKDAHKIISAKYRSAFPKAKWKKDKVVNMFETKVFVIQFENKSVSSKGYQTLYGVPVKGKLMLMSFVNGEGKQKKKWNNIANDVFQTMELN